MDGDVSPEAIVTVTVDVGESNLCDIRSYIAHADQGFAGSIQHGDVQFDFAAARLAEPLSDPDYSPKRNLRIVFNVQRGFIKNLIRPMGQPKVDPADIWFQQLHVLAGEKDLWRRRRIELGKSYAELDHKRLMLEDAEKGIALKTEALFAIGEEDWIKQARGRGF